MGVAEEGQGIALAAAAIDGAMRRRQEPVVGPAQQQLAAIDDKASGMAGASIQFPSWVRIERPGTSLGASTVRKLVSVCGAMPNSSSAIAGCGG